MRHVIEVYTPRALTARYEADHPAVLQAGDRIVIGDIAHVISTVEHEFTTNGHVTRVTTGDTPRLQAPLSPDVANFLRYHVLIRIFDGDVRRWLRIARSRSDVQFLESLNRRLASDPNLLENIREIVDSSGLWPNDPDA